MISKSFAALVVAFSLISQSAPAWSAGPDNSGKLDIKQAVPADVYFALYVRHNPQGDFQRAYFADAWKTFQDEQIAPRLLNIITSRMPPDKLVTAKDKLQELQTAVAPINCQALMNADEMIFAEGMQGPFNQVLSAVRLNSEDAADFERGVVQTFELLARWSDGKVTVNTSMEKDATITVLTLPKESPFQPAVARVNDIVVISSTVDLLRRGVGQLQDKSAQSKFDDPRLQAALAQLHQPDDALVFFDGKQMFQSLRGVGDFIRSQGGNDAKAARVASVMDRVIDETAIVDYTVTVQYTEPGHNHSVALIKMADGYEHKLLGRAIAKDDKSIDDWKSWIPADATSFSIRRGIDLHEMYDGVIKFVQEQFPESHEALDKFTQFQDKIGVNLDRDILQSFSGESACVTVPVTLPDGSTCQSSVSAWKCKNPDKVRELLTRAVDALNKLPAVQMQQLKLEDCNKLEGFQQVHASIFQMFGVQPVVGFRDGWMILACSQEAAEKILAARAGKAETVDASAMFAKFGLDPKLALCNVSYHDIGTGVRSAADAIDKIGAMAPMFLGMAAANAKPEEIKPAQELIGLLPSFAKVVRKFDFYGHSLSISRQGPIPDAYLQESVTEVHPPKGS
jgi:hypothetical protein